MDFIPMDYSPVEILTDHDPILKKVSQFVTEFDEKLEQLALTMFVSMKARNGVGLAAVQIGQLQRVIILRDDENPDRPLVMVNPVFLRKGNRFVTMFEGCLSLSGREWRNVSRPAKCEIGYQDIEGSKHVLNMSGDLARRAQHEMDHLDGILITDHPRV